MTKTCRSLKIYYATTYQGIPNKHWKDKDWTIFCECCTLSTQTGRSNALQEAVGHGHPFQTADTIATVEYTAKVKMQIFIHFVVCSFLFLLVHKCNKKLCYCRGTARRAMLVNSCCFKRN